MSSYTHFTEEEKEQARNTDLVSFLRHRGEALKRSGSEYEWTGVVALSAVVASGAAAGAVVEGFRSAKNTMQKILKKDEDAAGDEAETVTTDEVLAENSDEN